MTDIDKLAAEMRAGLAVTTGMMRDKAGDAATRQTLAAAIQMLDD